LEREGRNLWMERGATESAEAQGEVVSQGDRQTRKNVKKEEGKQEKSEGHYPTKNKRGKVRAKKEWEKEISLGADTPVGARGGFEGKTQKNGHQD